MNEITYELTQKQIIGFFIRHPKYFVDVVSKEYTFSENTLSRYKSLLNWEKVSENTSIHWNRNLLNRFDNLLDWSILSTNQQVFKNVDLIAEYSDKIVWKDDFESSTIAANEGVFWSIELIEKYKTKIDFDQLAQNPSINWTEALIDRFKEHWDFSILAHNSGLPWTLEFFNKYFTEENIGSYNFGFYHSDSCIIEFANVYSSYVDWSQIAMYSNLSKHKEDLLERWKDKLEWSSIASNKFLFKNSTFFSDHLDKWLTNPKTMFRQLSFNEELSCSINDLERFSEYWDWETLSFNPSLPWSIELIEKYNHKFVWGGFENREHLMERDEVEGHLILGTYHQGLIENTGLPWSIDFLLHFEDELDFEMLSYNSSVWEKAFKPYVTDELIDIVAKIV